jgi:hypothetical protein
MSLDDAIARLPDLQEQKKRICDSPKSNDDVVKDLFCSGKLQDIETMQSLLTELGLDPGAPGALGKTAHFETIGRSASLDAANVSPRRPAMVITGLGDKRIAVHFARGTAAVEIIAKDRKANQLNFYLMTYGIDCDAKKCTAREFASDKLESGWKDINLYSDTHLQNTGLDCRNCHTTDRNGERKFLFTDVVGCSFSPNDQQSGKACGSFASASLSRASLDPINEAGADAPEAPSTDVPMPPRQGGYSRPSGIESPETVRQVLRSFQDRHGSDSTYGGIASAEVSVQLESSLSAFDMMMPGMPGPGRIVPSTPPSGRSPGGPLPPGGPGLPGGNLPGGVIPPMNQPILFSSDSRNSNANEVLAAMAVSQAANFSQRQFDEGKFANHDIDEASLYDDDALPVNPQQLLHEACILCHHRDETPTFPASRFNALRLSATSTKEALERLTLPASDPRVMPPSSSMVLTKREKEALMQLLQSAATTSP